MSFILENLSFAYPQRNKSAASDPPKPVMRDVSLQIESGKITAVVGPSGVGKSTFLYLIGLLWEESPQAGSIAYVDRTGARREYADIIHDEAACAALRREEFGFALQSSYLLPTLTGIENIAMPLALAGMPRTEREDQARDLLEMADPTKKLLDRAGSFVHEFSGGERKRMAILRAIAHKPHVLLADEPVSNLDDVSADHIYDLMGVWFKGAPGSDRKAGDQTLVMVSHDVERADRFAHTIIELREGDAPRVRPAKNPPS